MKYLKIVIACIFILHASIVNASDDYIFRAMEDELKRSMDELQFEQFDKPYYISYRMVDSHRYYVSATLGAKLKQEEIIKRQLVVNLRVGDYKIDSSHLFELNFNRVKGFLDHESITLLPVDADYTEIRRQLWLATDAAYKKAVQNLAKKKAILQGSSADNRADDFLKVNPFKKQESENISNTNIESMIKTIQQLSVIANDHPAIQVSEFDWLFTSSYTRFINSENTRIGRNDNTNRILMRAETQTKDGEPLVEEEAIFASKVEDMPSIQLLKKHFNQRLKELSDRQLAAPMVSYVGPVLFKPQAAAELLRQTIAKQALAIRASEKDPSIRIQGFTANTLQGQIKQRILPRGFTIIDDPTVTQYSNQPLLGSYWADDQGVKAKRQMLIKNGRLIQLLSERSPISKVKVNAGNYLNGAISSSNLFLKSKSPMNNEELEQELFTLAEEVELDYGIVIERLDGGFEPLNKASNIIIFGGSTGLTLDGLSAYKLFKDGRKERIRQLQLPRFDIRSLKNIIAAGDDYSVYHAPSIPVGLSFFFNSSVTSKFNVSSFIVPSLLFEELSLSPQEDAKLSLPISEASQ